jgi:CheY-like chemotaxis protein
VARNTFLGKVSHEFNSPLQAMLTNIQLLEPRLPDERAQTIIRRLLTSVNQLRVQVSDLLDVAEIKSGKLTLRLARVDVPTLLSDIVGVHQIAADSKNLMLAVKAEGMPPVYTDGRRIAQIVTNLVTNAIRHTDHGSVSVQAQLVATRKGHVIKLAVADSGTGFAPEIRENLFQPFVQAKRYRGGTGLGLAIVKGLVDQFNGQIKLESQLGAGSTFIVEIPVSLEGDDAGNEDDLGLASTPTIAAPVEVAIVNGVDVANSRKPTVLIVEDNSDLLDTFSEFLQDSGFDVHAASSFQAGKSMLEMRRYFAIVTDMELGDGTGLDIAKVARAGRNASVPIVCCTAYPKLIEGEEAGIFNARLSKPLNPAALLKVLSKMTQDQPTERID